MKYNKSKTYLLPLINKYIKCYNIDKVVNCYTYNDLTSTCQLCILYDIPEDLVEDFKNYINSISENDYYISTIHKQYYVVMIRFPEELMEDYISFKNGRYSKLSTNSKVLIHDFLSVNNFSKEIITQVYGILYKTKKRREHLEDTLSIAISKTKELGSIPLFEDELIKLQEYDTI